MSSCHRYKCAQTQKVVDDLTSYISTKENTEIPLEDLGFSVDSSYLYADQLHMFYQILGKWRHIFCNSTKDIGKTYLPNITLY